MTTSSAIPANLDGFVTKSRGMDDELTQRLRTLKGVHNSFVAENRWGIFNAGSLLAGYESYINYNENDSLWVKNIADNFRRAGGTGALSCLPDAAIEASLRAAGLFGPRQSVTFEDPIAYGFPPTTGYADDPVNTASGNFVELENDLPFGALVEGLRFTRIYNSRSDRTGPFGPGWASWATARLRARPEGAEYEGPDGQRALIPRMGAGYGRIAGIDGLVETLPSGLALRWFGGGSWEFDEAGLPARAERGPGTEIRFRYEEGRLVEMLHEGGKRVAIEWTGERIVALDCNDGRRVEYRYDEHGSLVEALAAGGVRRYDVDDGGRILRVTDSDGVVEVDNTYDEDGRVLEQLSPFGRHTRFSYLPGRVTVNQDENDGPTNTYIHDHAGRMIGLVDGHGNRLSKSYDDWGNAVAITERNGATTVREWDDRSRLLRETRPGGEWVAYKYDDHDRILLVEGSNGAVTTYRYDGAERSPSEIVDAEGGVTKLEVSGGLVRRIIDPDGVELGFRFDRDGNIVAAIDGEGNEAIIERDAAGRPLVAIDPVGRRTEFTYDAHGHMTQRRDALGATWNFRSTTAGRPTEVVDPMGGTRELHYGTHGKPERLVDQLGHVTSQRFDESGNLAGVVSPDGAKWEFTYDGLCRLVGIHDPAGATWLREYDATGNLVGLVDPVGTQLSASVDHSGRVTDIADGTASAAFERDAFGKVITERNADGSETRVTYDLLGRRTSVTEPGGATTRFRYTAAGRLAEITSPMGRRTRFEYDRCGRLAARIEPTGRQWTFSYAPDGALLEVAHPGGGRERLAYDEVGRLVRRTVPGLGQTSYSYDLAGRVVSLTTPKDGTRRFTYDPAGRIVEAVDANGGVTRFTYNERGWVTETEDPMGGRSARSYDEVGRVVSETDQLGRQTSLTYDPAGRLIEQVDGASLAARRRYDRSGRLSSFGSGDGQDVTIERDAMGRATSIIEPGTRHEVSWDPAGRLLERRRGNTSLRWRYDADGYRATFGYPDGTEIVYRYDEGGDLIALEHPELGALEVTRDGAGRMLGLRGTGVEARWHYDDGQLAGYEVGGSEAPRSTLIERDEDGRVVSSTVDGATTSFSYDAAGQLVAVDAPAGRFAFRYDANGRLVEEDSPAGRTSYTYDAAGQLVERSSGGTITKFEFDGAGQRVRETTGAATKTYSWDRFGRLAEVRVSDGDIERATKVVVDSLGDLAAVNETAVMWDTADPLSPLSWLGNSAVISLGAPWALVSKDETRWLQPDVMGTMGEADPWGTVTEKANGALSIGYRGELQIDGLLWLRNRAYDAATRSFLSTDPLPAPVGVAWASNPYSYAGNDPTGSLDPLGLRPVTEAQLATYREAMNRSVWERAGDWTQDNWEYIAAGALVVAGVAVMATGVGGPVGAAMIGGALTLTGTSAASQKLFTGKVDWAEAGATGAVWALGVAAVTGGGVVGAGYLIGAGSSALIEGATTGQVDFTKTLTAGIIGGAAGWVGGGFGGSGLVTSTSTRIIEKGLPNVGKLFPFAAGGAAGGFTSSTLQETYDQRVSGEEFEVGKVLGNTFAGGVFGTLGGEMVVLNEMRGGAASLEPVLKNVAKAAGAVYTKGVWEHIDRGIPIPAPWPAPLYPYP